MSKDMHTVAGIPDQDFYEALAKLDGRTEDARTEYAVVWRTLDGLLAAVGGFSERPIALARGKGGVIAERQVITDFGLWTESPEPAEER